MVKEYIEREAAIQRIRIVASGVEFDNPLEAIDTCVAVIGCEPAVDVAPVRHERWEKHGSKWQCTGCKVLMSIDGTPQENLLYYCPFCGAKMDKEEE